MTQKKYSRPSFSLGQRKLLSFSIKLPLLPVTLHGALPLPRELIECRVKTSKKVLDPQILKNKEQAIMDLWIKEQEKMNVHVGQDGEFYRGDMISYFSSRISGFEPAGLVRLFGNRYFKKPIIKQKLAERDPLVVEIWPIAQRTSRIPIKAVLTGPYSLMKFSFNEFYESQSQLLRDLTKIMKDEILRLTQAGAKIIEISEPALSSNMEDFDLFEQSWRVLTKSVKAYFILHHCFGDISKIWNRLVRLPADNLSFSCAHCWKDICALFKSRPTRKDLTLGIVDSLEKKLESGSAIRKNILDIIKTIPPEQLWLSPDCGLKNLSPIQAKEKIKLLSDISAQVRRQIVA